MSRSRKMVLYNPKIHGDNASVFTAYWAAVAPITARRDATTADAKETLRKANADANNSISALLEASKKNGDCVVEFVSFFVENKDILPADMQDFVNAWIKENQGGFEQAQRHRAAASLALKARIEAIERLTTAVRETAKEVWDMGDDLLPH